MRVRTLSITIFIIVYISAHYLVSPSYGFITQEEMEQFPSIKLNGTSASLYEGTKLIMKISADSMGWAFPVDEITFRCAAVGYVVNKAMPFAFNDPVEINLSKWDQSHPRILFNRGPNKEYLVKFSDKGNQSPYIAFGFGQELGHVLIDYLKPGSPQMWFEEAFCEALAVWSLQQLALEWEKSIDLYYSKAFSSEAKFLLYDINPPTEGYPQWFAKNRGYLTGKINDRGKNSILAIKLIEYANADPTFFQSFFYLRKNYPVKVVDSMEWVLKRWWENCPDHLKSGPERVAKLLGIKFAEEIYR
ncbi:hypothetical protein [Geobacter sp. OR-1]|uniref:hypothetical protein n=1 Tax=Geobacter sp. OR-1 TaxID=1266765 RepID=UPI000B137AF4|nr:hypothetical protein [Geobacter sp. OR-1]